MERFTLDSSRSTWTCLGCDVPLGMSQCPTCGGVRFNHVAAKTWRDRILAIVRRRDGV